MSTTTTAGHGVVVNVEPAAAINKEGSQNYKGFVAGVFSGVSKLTGKLFRLRFNIQLELSNFQVPSKI
jgi:hypothetical protein